MKALVVVEYQNDFVDGSLGSPEALSIEDALCARLEEVLSEGGDLYFTLDTHGTSYLNTFEGKRLPVEHCQVGTFGVKIHGKVGEYVPKGTVLSKTTFGCSRLLEELKDYDEIEICGVATDICVLANAVMARTANPEARITVRRDCVASYDREAGEKALDVMGSLQIDVV